jgi:cytochrome c oxidase subunit I
MLNETLGRVHFVLTFVGAYATFMPMYLLGLAAHPRRYSQLIGAATYLQPLLPVQKIITYAALVTATAQLIFVWNLFHSFRNGKPAGNNPWSATTLEWATTSPPPAGDFPADLPAVFRRPDDFYPIDHPDFIPQWLEEG